MLLYPGWGDFGTMEWIMTFPSYWGHVILPSDDSSIIFQSLPNHVVSSSFIPYEKPMISEVSLRTIRGGIPGFVLVSYKPLYHISLRISNETTICLSLNPHMNI